jgi:hypothetical protein
MMFSSISESNCAPEANSPFLPTQTENTSFILPTIPRPVSYTQRSLGTDIIVTAHNLGLNDATIMESAR